MEAKDLRMYNYIYKYGDIYEVWEETFSEMSYERDIKWDPIILTEEWLIKFGFSKDGEYYSKGYFHYHECGNIFIGNDHVSGGNVDANIKYVHQLQNLYFALKGIELQLK